MRRIIAIIAILTAIATTVTATAKREYEQVSTPSPAPTKTEINPETTATQETVDPTPEENTSTGETRTITQSELKVITGNVQRPNGAVWFDNKLYVVCTGDWTIYTLDDTTGATQTYIYGVRNGHSLYAEAEGQNSLTLWVPDINTGQLLKVNPARAPEPVIRNLDSPWGIAYLNSNSFLITSLNGNSIILANRDGGTMEITTGLRSPTGIAVDTENQFAYVANSGSARRAIEWINTAEINTEEAPDDAESLNLEPQPLVSGLQNTTGVALGSDGKLYFTYALGTRGVVGRVDPQKCRENGGCTNDEVEIVVYTELAAPLAGLTISPDMELFIHTMFRPEIYRAELN